MIDTINTLIIKLVMVSFLVESLIISENSNQNSVFKISTNVVIKRIFLAKLKMVDFVVKFRNRRESIVPIKRKNRL